MRRLYLATTPEPGDELVEGNARFVGAVYERRKIFGILGKTDSHRIVHHVGETPIRRRRFHSQRPMYNRVEVDCRPLCSLGHEWIVAS